MERWLPQIRLRARLATIDPNVWTAIAAIPHRDLRATILWAFSLAILSQPTPARHPAPNATIPDPFAKRATKRRGSRLRAGFEAQVSTIPIHRFSSAMGLPLA